MVYLWSTHATSSKERLIKRSSPRPPQMRQNQRPEFIQHLAAAGPAIPGVKSNLTSFAALAANLAIVLDNSPLSLAVPPGLSPRPRPLPPAASELLLLLRAGVPLLLARPPPSSRPVPRPGSLGTTQRGIPYRGKDHPCPGKRSQGAWAMASPLVRERAGGPRELAGRWQTVPRISPQRPEACRQLAARLLAACRASASSC